MANRTLALHLPGGRQLFVTTGGALWIQQRSSGVCYKRRKDARDQRKSDTNGSTKSNVPTISGISISELAPESVAKQLVTDLAR